MSNITQFPDTMSKRIRKRKFNNIRLHSGRQVLVEGQDIREELTGQVVEDTEWRRTVKGQWRAMEQAAVRRGWVKDMERDKVYDRG